MIAARGADASRAGRAWLAALAVAAGALALLWPAMVWGPLAFPDSLPYYRGGAAAVRFAAEALLGAGPAPEVAPSVAATPGASATASGAVTSLRSLPYSLFVYLGARLGGVILPIAATAALTAWVAWAVTGGHAARGRLAALLAALLLTTAPFYASQLMPDVFAAFPIALALAAVLRGDELGPWARSGLLGAAALAALFHYSHLPLMAVMGAALGLWWWRRGERGWALAAQAPLALALGANLAVSLVIAGGPSVAPGRWPIMLARSLEDGPAADYLEATCPGNGFTICQIYDGAMPRDVHSALWGKDGIRFRATPAQQLAILAEEGAVLRAALRHDPLAQVRAFARNGLRQLWLVGLSDHWLARFEIDGETGRMRVEMSEDRPPAFLWAERVQAAALAAALLALAWLFARGAPGHRSALGLLALGLVVNAVICGGLSAPTDRYQGRVVWLVVLAAAAMALGPVPGRDGPRRRERG